MAHKIRIGPKGYAGLRRGGAIRSQFMGYYEGGLYSKGGLYTKHYITAFMSGKNIFFWYQKELGGEGGGGGEGENQKTAKRSKT